MHNIPRLISYILLGFIVCSCIRESEFTTSSGNSIYYWRTTFSLSDKEKQFLKNHDISKIYMRYFDVEYNYTPVNGENIMPGATIIFNDTVPAGIEIVPTVYISNHAMDEMQLKEKDYAEKIVKRVNAICRKNNIEFKELQLDCDWTKTTRKYFFRLCEAVKNELDTTRSLSSTIRLHQLTQDPPPVDKGVLMVYNTGNLMEITTANSIFSPKDIRPYLKDNRLSEYPLPIDVAYPSYGWSIVFRSEKENHLFDRIMRRTDFSSYPSLVEIEPHIYEARFTLNLSSDPMQMDIINQGYRVKVERPDAKEILEVKKMIDRQLKGKHHHNILYHLDENQLSHYSDYEISKIYTRN